LGKLPEIQDGISASERETLNTIIDIYNENPKSCDEVFNQMYRVGIPEIRKYCSPLQAYFWLVDRKQIEKDQIRKALENFKLRNLLAYTWGKMNPVITFNKIPEKDMLTIINGIKEPNLKDGLLKVHNRGDYVTRNSALASTYRRRHELFSFKGLWIISKYVAEDWKDFNTVKERLNAPELVQYWLKANFKYLYDKEVWVYDDWAQSPKETFKRRTGDCEDMAILGVYLLSKNGYTARVINECCEIVPGVGMQGHAFGAYEVTNGDKKEYYKFADTKNPDITGPYKSFNEAGWSGSPNAREVDIRKWYEALHIGSR